MKKGFFFFLSLLDRFNHFLYKKTTLFFPAQRLCGQCNCQGLSSKTIVFLCYTVLKAMQAHVFPCLKSMQQEFSGTSPQKDTRDTCQPLGKGKRFVHPANVPVP